MINIIKGFFVGLGAIAPGLSGSVMMVIFGLYDKVIEAVGTFFKDIKKNVLLLIPIGIGGLLGIFAFSKFVDYLLNNYEMYTRYAFLGLVIGTIPLFFKEVKEDNFKDKYYILMIISFVVGLGLLFLSKGRINEMVSPNFIESIILGVVVSASMIIPGVDSAVILSVLGLYNIYVSALANVSISVLIPMGLGFVTGGLFFSFFMNKLLKKNRTIVFSIIFGLFIAIIPSVLNSSCYLGFNLKSIVAVIIMFIGILVSYFLGKLKKDDIKTDV